MTLDSAALSQLDSLDSLDPADALRVVAAVRAATLAAEHRQILRARAHRLSWRSIATALGTNATTARRWARLGLPEHTRRRDSRS